MKIGAIVGVILSLLALGALGVTVICKLLTLTSDAAVLAGIALAITCIALLAGGVSWFWKKTRSIVPALFLLAALGSSGCWTVVEPGNVGIRVNQSGSDRGVQDYPLQSGRVFYNPITETVFTYPVHVQRAIWSRQEAKSELPNEEINYNSKDELVFTGDFTVSYELVKEDVPKFYVKFRNDNIQAFTHGFFRDQVRDALNETAVKYTADELYGEKKTEFVDRSLARIRERVSEFGVRVISLGYASSPRPPAQVATAINTKIAAIQLATQKENELRQAEADAKKTVAFAEGEAKKKIALAEGEAKANELVSRSINGQIVQWRQMEIQQEAVHKWNGVMPQYTGSGAVPFINVGK